MTIDDSNSNIYIFNNSIPKRQSCVVPENVYHTTINAYSVLDSATNKLMMHSVYPLAKYFSQARF